MGERPGRIQPSLDPIPTAGWAALILRCTVGITFLAHGIQKIVAFGWTGGIPNFHAWGIPVAEIAYPLTVVTEAVGGLFLLVGLSVRPAAAALTVVMLVALVTVHLPHGFFLPHGIEFVLVLAAASLAVVLLGPGKWAVGNHLRVGSIDRWLSSRTGQQR